MPVVVDARMLFQKTRAINAGLSQGKILRAVGLRLMGWVARNFEDDGTEQKWKPLSPNTVAQRRKGSNRPLQDTGRLKQSWTKSTGNPHIIGDTVSVTSNMKYAPYHEFGTGPYTIKPKKGKRLAFMTAGGMRFPKEVHHPGVPKRRMTPTDALAKELALSTINAYIDKAVKTAKGSS